MFVKCMKHSFGWGSRYQVSRSASCRTMDLKDIVNKLNEFAPLRLAKEWDNVGLLVEPSNHHVSRILLTNDLTLKVLEEAIATKASMIISYHPPIFNPLKRLTQNSWKEKILIRCLENLVAVYSPHTCWDAVEGGLNDWLISPFAGRLDFLSCHVEQKYNITIFFKSQNESAEKQKVIEEVEKLNCDFIFDGSSIKLTCLKHHLKLFEAFSSISSIELQEIKHMNPKSGDGRIVLMDVPMKIKYVVDKMKEHLKLDRVQLAMGYQLNEDSLVTSIAVCAGSGSSVLRGIKADILITGEMSHHDVLEVCHQRGGTCALILCGHSNTERGFLTVMMHHLQDVLSNSVAISLSMADCDPIKIV